MIIKLYRDFFWSGDINKGRGLCLVNWKSLEFFKEMGGLNLGNILSQILFLLVKWVWRYKEEEKVLWNRVIREKYSLGCDFNVLELEVFRVGGFWRDICKFLKKNK